MRDSIQLAIVEVTGRTDPTYTGRLGQELRAKMREIVERPTRRIAPPRRAPGDIHPLLAEPVEHTSRDWRLGNIHLRHDWNRERFVFCAGYGDIWRLRLTRLFLPIIRTVGKIEHDIKAIAGK